MTRPRLLDGCCRGGGAGVGYRRVGFDVWGADIEYSAAYPFAFVRADIRDLLVDSRFMAMFSAVHVSTPCPENSRTRHLRDAQGGTVREHGRDIIAEVRELLNATNLPYVMENVPQAPMRPDLVLCGSHFGLHVMRGDRYRPLRRHRWFESNVDLGPQPVCDHTEGRPLGVYGTTADDIPAGGQTCRTVREAGELMGIDWMTRWTDIKEAIPPAYTEHVGSQIAAHLSERVA